MIRSKAALVVWALGVTAAMSPAVQAEPISGTLYYTRFQLATDNVRTVTYTYDGGTQFSYGTPQTVASIPGNADGILFAPDGDLLVGGGGARRVFKIDPTTGSFTSAPTAGVRAFHLALDPSQTKVWTSDFPGNDNKLVEVPLSPTFGPNGTAHTISGVVSGLTQLAFVPDGRVFFTSSDPNGNGRFGTIDLTTFVTTGSGLGILQAAHGMQFDPYTGDIILFGAGAVTQIRLSPGLSIVSHRVFPNFDFDQGSVDGAGHAFIASSSGRMFFIDYSATGLIGSLSNFVANPFLDTNLDDVAPLSGLGAPQQSGVPEPTSLLSLAIGLLGLAGCRLYLRTR